MVGIPLSVGVGDIWPHCDAEQDTVQVTPLFAVSLATVAVNVVGLLAGTKETPAGATLTLIAGPAITGCPPPPQPASSIRNASPKSESAKDTERCITPPQGRNRDIAQATCDGCNQNKPWAEISSTTMPGTSFSVSFWPFKASRAASRPESAASTSFRREENSP